MLPARQDLRIEISAVGLWFGTSDALRVHSFADGSKVKPLQSDTIYENNTSLRRNSF